MLICAACSAEVPPAAQHCARCGGRLFSSAIESVGETIPTPPVRPPAPTATTGVEYTAGEVVAERYRIVGLLGRGGMGEVYRADDLVLGHPVALKFLPRSVEQRADLLDRLRAEVRVTRQISHPNVCRVYDIGSANGRTFLTMEYIDGEDLASLLRRIGRLPPDKALDIARQLCAGLAAAHEREVIHRDLKPSNVMLDGRGKVRVADFGLAVVAHGGSSAADRAGTPAYMAPEQLDGGALSARTDVYALGLVLYELFTGRPLFNARTFDELRAGQRDLERLRLSASDVNLDPAVERVVMRCVEFDAARRPDSALAVAAALPGGDPLAAALAAGETPSPQLVAAAGEGTTISPLATIALMLAAVIGCAVSAASGAQRSAFALLQPPYSGEVLAVKAAEMLQRLRPGDAGSAAAASFDIDSGFVRSVSRSPDARARWNALAAARPGPLYFWRRTSPRQLWPREIPGGKRVSETDPPRTIPGMTLLQTDLRGRLVYLDARPSRPDDERPAAAAPWPQLFQEADLDVARFTPATPEWMPPSWGDARAAWTGTTAEAPGLPLRVEAASYLGRPILFVVAAPWTLKPGEVAAAAVPAPTAAERAFVFSLLGVAFAALAAAVFMAVRSVRAGRADRRGAWRLALFVAVSQLIATLLAMAHVPDFVEGLLLLAALTFPVASGGVVWALYAAFEPYIRRVWPSALISWNRVLDGRFRDIRVARDVLVGSAVTGLIDLFDPLTARVATSAPRGLSASYFREASATRDMLSGLVNTVDASLFAAFMLVFFFVGIRMLVRRDWIAMSVLALVLASLLGGLSAAATAGGPRQTLVLVTVGLLVGYANATLLVRFGLMAVVAQWLTENMLSTVVTLSPSAWYSAASLINFAAVLAIPLAAGWACLSMSRRSVAEGFAMARGAIRA